MRIFFCAVLLVFLFSGISFCQTKLPKGYAALNLGISFPLNDFAGADSMNEKSGFAETGFRLSMPFAYLLNDNFGIGGILFTQKNQLDLDKVKTQLQLPPNAELYAIPWSAEGLLAGLYFSFPLDTATGIFLDTKIMGGIASAQIPVFFINAVYYSRGYYSSYYAISKSASVFAFGYSFDVSIRYNLSEKLSFLFGGNYFSSAPEFKDVPQYGTTKNTYAQPITTFNIDVGIAYLLK